MIEESGHAPVQELPSFRTERFVVTPLAPQKLRRLMEILLRDELLAEHVDWMQEKSADSADREAFLLELQCATGAIRAWGVVDRASAIFVGALLVRSTLEGFNVEVLCASQFWDQGISDEVMEPVANWLEEFVEVETEVVH